MAKQLVMSSVLKQIINEIFALEDFKCDRLAQYLRCMVQILLPMGDDALVRQVLEQAIQTAEEAKQASLLLLFSFFFFINFINIVG